MRFIKLVLFLLYIMFFISCENKYEKAVIGDYKVMKYKVIDSIKGVAVKNLKLSLYDNKKFKIDVENRKIIGEWRAYDDGDRTLIEFKIKDKFAEGVVVGEKLEIIEMWNGEHLFYKDLEEISFQRK